MVLEPLISIVPPVMGVVPLPSLMVPPWMVTPDSVSVSVPSSTEVRAAGGIGEDRAGHRDVVERQGLAASTVTPPLFRLALLIVLEPLISMVRRARGASPVPSLMVPPWMVTSDSVSVSPASTADRAAGGIVEGVPVTVSLSSVSVWLPGP